MKAAYSIFKGCSMMIAIVSAILLSSGSAATVGYCIVRQASTASSGTTQGSQDVSLLEIGKPIEREIVGGKAHHYQLTLASGEYLHVVVEQKGIDVVVALFGPDGKKLVEVDSPNGNQGPEPVSLIAERSGSHRVQVRSLKEDAPAGRYEVKIAELRIATAQDRSRVLAKKAYTEGERLQGQETALSFRKAIEKYEEALRHWRASGDRQEEATTLSSIGQVYNVLGEKQKVLEYFNQALMLRRSLGDSRGEATTLNNLGVVYAYLGESQKAIEYYNQALTHWRSLGALGEATTLINLGKSYYWLGEKQKALEYYHQALLAIRARGDDRQGVAVVFNNIGEVYDSLGEKQKALEYFNQALTLRRAANSRRGIAGSLNSIGQVYNSLGQKQKALEYFNQALQLSRDAGYRKREAATLNNIGRIYYSLGEKQKAFEYYNQALALFRDVGDRGGEADALHGVAQIARDRGDLIQARSHIEEALNITEDLRTNVINPELRASYFASVQPQFEFYIDLLMQMHRLHPSQRCDAVALQATERARARSLLDMLIEARADIRQGVDPMLLERERSLLQQLNAAIEYQARLLDGKNSPGQAAAASKQVSILTAAHGQVQAQIRARSPRHAALTQSAPVSLKQIQQLLDPDTLLLEYALGEERSFLFLVTSTSMTTYTLPARKQIEEAAKVIIRSLTEGGAPGEFESYAARLSQMLLGPVAAQLRKKRLAIVADGLLQYMPFAALPAPSAQGSEKGKRQKGRTDRPLIVDHEIVGLPSASALATLRSQLAVRKTAPKSLAILADPVFSKNDERVKEGADQATPKANSPGVAVVARDFDRATRSARQLGLLRDGVGWPSLPFSRREAEQILALVPRSEAKAALDFDASQTTALSAELSQYRLVHFATHGVVNDELPELSGLVLSLVNEKGEQQDGFLSLPEVFNLSLTAELVVLSACRTGLGKEVRGEGLVGLTRGFMYAGAPRVVSSLWAVEDHATLELMARFYKAMLKRKLSAADALRQAQVSMWREGRWGADQWAGFIFQGEWR